MYLQRGISQSDILGVFKWKYQLTRMCYQLDTGQSRRPSSICQYVYYWAMTKHLEASKTFIHAWGSEPVKQIAIITPNKRYALEN